MDSRCHHGAERRLMCVSGIGSEEHNCDSQRSFTGGASQKRERAKQAKRGTRMLSLLWEAIIGLIVGVIAKLLMPGKDPGGIWITMAIGIAGSIVATYLGQLIGWYRAGQTAGFIMSIVGAVLLLILYRYIRRMLVKP